MQRRDPNLTRAVQLLVQAGRYGIDVGECRAGSVSERPPFDSESHAACVSLEKLHPQGRLERPHMVADRTGSQTQLLGRMSEVLVSSGYCEDTKGGKGSRP
jgi:hypothetical protein